MRKHVPLVQCDRPRLELNACQVPRLLILPSNDPQRSNHQALVEHQLFADRVKLQQHEVMLADDHGVQIAGMHGSFFGVAHEAATILDLLLLLYFQVLLSSDAFCFAFLMRSVMRPCVLTSRVQAHLLSELSFLLSVHGLSFHSSLSYRVILVLCVQKVVISA